MEIEPDDLESALEDYYDLTSRRSGKYQCRDCGKNFDTLEAHDLHWRKVHSESDALLAGMPM